MIAARAVVERALEGDEAVYGINTGFGHLAHVRIEHDKLARLQGNLIRSHAVGVGRPFDKETSRGILLLRAAVVAKGQSGVRPEVADSLLDCLNADLIPVIPRQGSVGASGDLAPLAHLVLAMMGTEGGLFWDGDGSIDAAEALAKAKIAPLRLEAKEGLSLINGTQAMTALGVRALLRAEYLACAADLAAAMTVEASLASHRPFDARLHALRPHPGQEACAANMRAILDGSSIVGSHEDCDKVQDPYSMRCVPQVHGAARDLIAHTRRVLEVEINSVTDNPTVFDNGDIISGGNFHGEPVAMAMDVLTLAVHELGSISERRMEQLVNPNQSHLPAFLAPTPGLDSGLMMAQVTAAALVSENRGLCLPASADSIPTSALQEDHVSMGPIAARKSWAVVENVEHILAIEFLAAAQALEHRRPLTSSPVVEQAHALIRTKVPALTEDVVLAPLMASIVDLIRTQQIVAPYPPSI